MSASVGSLYSSNDTVKVHMAGKTKEKLINLRISPQSRMEFKIACEIRGATMSGALHQYIFRTIRAEKDKYPEYFTPEVVEARIVEEEQEEARRKSKGVFGGSKQPPSTTEQPTMQNTQQSNSSENALLKERTFEANLDVPGLTYDDAPQHESTVEPRVHVEDEVEDALREQPSHPNIKARRRKTS